MDRSALLEALWAKVDGFVAKVDERYPGALTCHAGCSDCCLGGLSVTLLEAEAIERLVDTLDEPTRARLAERTSSPSGDRCVALESDGRCSIYGARPIVCRSHGVPIRFQSSLPELDLPQTEVRRLPMIDVCPRNFVDVELESVSADCVLDQTTLSTALGGVDAAGRSPEERGRRVDLADWLARCASREGSSVPDDDGSETTG